MVPPPRAHVVRLLDLSTLDLSSAAALSRKLWLFFGTFTLRTSLTISYPILVVLSLESVRDRLFNSTCTRPYYGDRKRISVILSFPDKGQLLVYSSNPHLLINMVATHHRFERGGIVFFDYRRASICGCALFSFHTCVCGWSVYARIHREAILEN